MANHSKILIQVLVVPFGKLEEVRKDFLDADTGAKYWEWCEAQVKPYV